MTKNLTKYRFLIAAGGTGGHLYPAIAVAEAIKQLKPESEILFVGSANKIEGSVTKQLGYSFKNISVKGFNRKISLKTFLFPFYLIYSLFQSLLIVMKFNPKVSIATGGYISGPPILAASIIGSKIILIESNSYPGITTRLLEKYADEIHINYEYTKKFLRRQNILKLTGNPVRIKFQKQDKINAVKKFNLSESNKILLILGGSLGAKSINEAIKNSLEHLINNQIQIIWQVGKKYYDYYKNYQSSYCKIYPFIENIDEAFSACDLIITRAGASTISEIAFLGLPAILIPSPNVAENHQYYNAKAIADNNAAILLEDDKINTQLSNLIVNTIYNEKLLFSLSVNIKKFSNPQANYIIAKNAFSLIESN